RPDKGQHFAALEREIDVPRRDHAAEGFAQVVHLQQSHACLSRQYRIVPTRPLGKIRTMAMMLMPRKRRHKGVSGMIWSRRACRTPAPTRGPVIVWMPPRSSMVRASTEAGMLRRLGSTEPREKA